jgi:hypothetical protein
VDPFTLHSLRPGDSRVPFEVELSEVRGHLLAVRVVCELTDCMNEIQSVDVQSGSAFSANKWRRRAALAPGRGNRDTRDVGGICAEWLLARARTGLSERCRRRAGGGGSAGVSRSLSRRAQAVGGHEAKLGGFDRAEVGASKVKTDLTRVTSVLGAIRKCNSLIIGNFLWFSTNSARYASMSRDRRSAPNSASAATAPRTL